MDFDAWFGQELGGRARERLARVHEALILAGPPPPLPLSLRRPPQAADDGVAATGRTRRRRLRAAAAAAVVCFAAASIGYVLASGGDDADGWVAMRATAAAPEAAARLWVGARDRAGNRPLTLRVRGLPAGSYEMLLTERGKLVGSCGTFKADGGTTAVELTVPFRLSEYSDWVIARRRSDVPLLTTT